MARARNIFQDAVPLAHMNVQFRAEARVCDRFLPTHRNNTTGWLMGDAFRTMLLN